MARDRTPDPKRVAVVGLTARVRPPVPASPRTRDSVPGGYGTREQCLPFVAAAALGFTVPSPFAWGFCPPAEVPEGACAFRSPVAGGCPDRVFYVADDPAHGFERNRFALAPDVERHTGPLVVPGLSFFDRTDQQDHVKLHLPYLWRSADAMDLLFLPPVNRARADGLTTLSGVVETGWYAAPVNLVFALPPAPGGVHVAPGEAIAQAIPLPRAVREARLETPEPHRREVREILSAVPEWHARHDADRSAYKRLARSRAGAATADD